MPRLRRKSKEGDREFLARVDASIQRQMAIGDASSEAVAESLCITSQQLRRKLKAILGVTSSDYIARYRIDYAKKLLLDPDCISFAQVSVQCGFSNPGNFSRSFRILTGMTPTEFCNQNDENNKNPN